MTSRMTAYTNVRTGASFQLAPNKSNQFNRSIKTEQTTAALATQINASMAHLQAIAASALSSSPSYLTRPVVVVPVQQQFKFQVAHPISVALATQQSLKDQAAKIALKESLITKHKQLNNDVSEYKEFKLKLLINKSDVIEKLNKLKGVDVKWAMQQPTLNGPVFQEFYKDLPNQIELFNKDLQDLEDAIATINHEIAVNEHALQQVKVKLQPLLT